MSPAFRTIALIGKYKSPEIAESLKKAVGFRNVAVHNYDAIDWAIVMSICRDKLPDFKQFAEQVIRSESD